MKFRTAMLMMIAMLVASVTLASTAMAQESQAELKSRFEKRYPQIVKLLDQGVVGETWQGYLEAVKSDAKVDDDAKKLVAEENADRKKLYELLAAQAVEDGKKKMTAIQVGERNARRKFVEAKANWHLKAKEGNRWFQRSDVTSLKKSGKIGETWQGYVDAVKSESAEDPQIKAVVLTENQIRKDDYRKRSDEHNVTVEMEGEAAAKQYFSDAKPGEYIMRKGGEWEQKKK